MTGYQKVAGVWKKFTPYGKLSDTWQSGKEGYVKDAGVWKQWWLGGGVNDSTFTTYDAWSGINLAITAMAIQSDGKTIIGGNFTSYSGRETNRLARFNTDGTLDTTFATNIGTGLNNRTEAIEVDPNGKIYIGGVFTTFNGVTVNYFVRLNSDGTLDTDFMSSVGTNRNASINAIAFQSDGKILLGGNFTVFNTTSVNRLIRLNSDGTADSSFVTNIGTGSNNGIYAIAVQSDGKIVLGGDTSIFNDVFVRAVRLNSDGTLDSDWVTNVGSSTNSTIRTILIRPDQKVLIGGAFTTFNGNTVNRIVLLNTDGTRDTTFTTNTGTAFNNSVNSIRLQSDGSIIAVGDFTQFGGVTVNYIVKLASTGSRNTTFTTNNGTGPSNGIAKVVIQSDDKIVIGGSIQFFNGGLTNYFLRINASGGRDSSFPPSINYFVNNAVNDARIQSDGKIIVVGVFAFFNATTTTTVNRIVRLNTDQTLDTAFFGNTGTGANNACNTIRLQSDGQIVIGGTFTTWNGTTVNRIVRLNSDGTRDTAFTTNAGTGANNSIQNLAIQSDGKIVIVGDFSTWNGTTVNRIVRLNSDGTRDTAFTTAVGTASTNAISDVAIQSDGKILVGGSFVTFNGQTASKLIRLNSDGSRDTTFMSNLGTSFNNNAVTVIRVQSNGKILVGGSFTSFNGASINRLLRLNSDGTLDSSFTNNLGTGFNTGTLEDALFQADEKIVVCGNFSSVNGSGIIGIVRLNEDGTLDTVFLQNAQPGFNAGLFTVNLDSTGRIIAGGAFTGYRNITRGRLARLGGE